MAEKTVEVWKNTSPGLCWYVGFDTRGAEKAHLVQGYKTFTLTTLERQMNQEKAASPEQDLFRNGTFVLAKGSEETEQDEIASPNAMTDAEIADLVRELIHGDSVDVGEALAEVTSLVTVKRIKDELVLEDAPASIIAAVDAKARELNPAAPVERQVVATAPTSTGTTTKRPRKTAAKE